MTDAGPQPRALVEKAVRYLPHWPRSRPFALFGDTREESQSAANQTLAVLVKGHFPLSPAGPHAIIGSLILALHF